MKSKVITTSLLAIILAASVNAQDAASKVTDPANRTEAVAQRCKENNSIFFTYAKSQNYADAYEPWLELYETCPEMSKNIYKYGVLILDWKISQEKDPAKKAELFNKLMGVYDSRIKYFGDDANIPTARILGYKAIDYYRLDTPSDPNKKEAYKWLEQSINSLGNSTDAAFLQYYIAISAKIYSTDKTHVEKLIQDFIKANEIIEKNAASTNAAAYASVKAANNQTIAATKALDVATLDKIYGEKIEANKTNLEYLKSTLALYSSLGETKSAVFFKASIYAHAIAPSEESAEGIAKGYDAKKDADNSIKYYEEATALSTNAEKKAEYQYNIASQYFESRSFSKARQAARNAIEFKPNFGNAYILIGIMYAQSSGIYSDPVLSKTVYYAAVDKFNKAKQVDPSVAAEANKNINTYSRYFPSKDEVFMHPDLESGSSFTVGGWIGESTICR